MTTKLTEIVQVMLQQVILVLAKKLMEAGEIKAAGILLEVKPDTLI